MSFGPTTGRSATSMWAAQQRTSPTSARGGCRSLTQVEPPPRVRRGPLTSERANVAAHDGFAAAHRFDLQVGHLGHV